MTKRTWLNSFVFLLMAGGFCSPAFAQGVYKSLCDTAPGCASNGCANGGCASGAAAGCADPGCGCASGAGAGCADNGCGCASGAGAGCADAGCGCAGAVRGLGSGLGFGLGSGLLKGCADGGCADAGDGCADLCGEEACPWNIGGWAQTGYHTLSNGQFNNYPDRFQLHQGYVYVERTVDGSQGLDFGGRIDYVYGTDGPDTQAFGNNPGRFDEAWDNGGFYGHAIPQLYGEVAMGDISVKVGHFYTLVGYEVVTAPDNFFYSHSFTMYNAEPFTHTGAYATVPMGDVTAYGGWVQGWDTGFDDNNGSQFLGGFALDLAEGLSATYITTIGNIGNGTNLTGYSSSFVTVAQMTEKLSYVSQSDYVDYNDAGGPTADRRAYGLNNYLLYSLTEKIGLGTRMEWWNTEVAPGNNADLYGITTGFNVRPTENVIIRPELRWNKDEDGAVIPVANNEKVIFGIDGIITF